MIILGISICLIVISILFFLSSHRRTVKLDQIEQKKERLKEEVENLLLQSNLEKQDLQAVKNLIKSSQSQVAYINNTINEKQQEHKKILKQIQDLKKQSHQFYNQQKEIVQKQLEEFKEVSSKAAENYFDNLQEAYKVADAAHVQKLARLKEEQDAAAAALNNLKETRKAAYEALLKQQEIKENKDSYRLLPIEQDLQDIYALENVKRGLNKPRILSMLIWQTYYQPLAKKQFPIILKDKTKMGIYKITNIRTDQSYIGQSVDIYKRWTDHCKAGLGIDTPVGNKLYQSMLSDGLQNFTFELLCECPKEELDEKEKYFIGLYQADLYGFNGTKGNK